MAQLFIGTSGWNYKHWKGLFYPDDLPARRWLEYYAQHFNSAEVNYSFYRLPRPETYAKWVETVPPDFLFTLKCSRLITHAKRLNNLTDLWDNFLRNAATLDKQLGPILCQLPESFAMNIGVLDGFLRTAQDGAPFGMGLRLAIEFRHESWFNPQVFKVLEKYNTALVDADSSRFPGAERQTADFAYFRYHGPGQLFASKYSDTELKQEAAKLTKALNAGLDVYAYFNNDGFGYAIDNALKLKSLVESKMSRRAG